MASAAFLIVCGAMCRKGADLFYLYISDPTHWPTLDTEYYWSTHWCLWPCIPVHRIRCSKEQHTKPSSGIQRVAVLIQRWPPADHWKRANYSICKNDQPLLGGSELLNFKAFRLNFRAFQFNSKAFRRCSAESEVSDSAGRSWLDITES